MGPVAQPAREVVVRSGAARLYVRDVGRGRPIVVGHGGPDFDHEYLLPELDLLADSARLVYYDQRGRGRSFHGGLPVIRRLRVGFTSEGIVRAREIEAQLYEQTWSSESYDRTPQLRHLRIPTLVIHGQHDFIPVGIAERIAAAIPHAQLSVLPKCGHFAYLEQPDQVRRHLAAFLATN